jgi:hypothetical protein
MLGGNLKVIDKVVVNATMLTLIVFMSFLYF